MLTPSTTIPGATSSLHDFGMAILIMVGFFLVMGWWIGGKSRRRSKRRRVKTIAPLHAWKVDGRVDYKLYTASPQWRHRRDRITRRQHGCQWNMHYVGYPTGGDSIGLGWLGGCRERGPFHGHHMTYRNLGRERKGEVVKLCHGHHALVPTRPHPPFAEQQVFFGLKRQKVAA